MNATHAPAARGASHRGTDRFPRLGLAMRRHRNLILGLQWFVVLGYMLLLVVPALLPLPPERAHSWDDITRFAQFVFWGLWWPFVILSVMLAGRSWCGVLCPEGALTEWVSRFGLGQGIPHWMKWSGWPFVAFILTTVFGQMTSVYDYPKPALLILGGSTLAAIATGLVWGRGKRVWCRHLCPVSGVFGLLARVAPVHFAVDRTAMGGSSDRAAHQPATPGQLCADHRYPPHAQRGTVSHVRTLRRRARRGASGSPLA